MENQAPVTQIIETSQVAQENPKVEVAQPRSNFLTILLSLLLFASILIAGFFAYQTQQLVKELQVMSSKETNEPTIEPIATTDPTANWKTYSGKIFSFKYPEEMSLKRQDIEDPNDSKNIGDMVTLSDNSINLQVSSNFAGGWGGLYCVISKDKIIDGQSSTLMYFQKSENEIDIDKCLDQYKGFVALIGNKMFEHPYPILVELQPKVNGGTVDLDLFEKILSTFKFTN